MQHHTSHSTQNLQCCRHCNNGNTIVCVCDVMDTQAPTSTQLQVTRFRTHVRSPPSMETVTGGREVQSKSRKDGQQRFETKQMCTHPRGPHPAGRPRRSIRRYFNQSPSRKEIGGLSHNGCGHMYIETDAQPRKKWPC